MRSKKLIAVFVVPLAAMLAACSDSSDNGFGPTGSSGNMDDSLAERMRVTIKVYNTSDLISPGPDGVYSLSADQPGQMCTEVYVPRISGRIFYGFIIRWDGVGEVPITPNENALNRMYKRCYWWTTIPKKYKGEQTIVARFTEEGTGLSVPNKQEAIAVINFT